MRKTTLRSLGGWTAGSLVVLAMAICTAPAAASDRAALIEKGQIQFERGHFKAALKTFLSAEQTGDGPCGECQLGLAQVHGKKKDWRKAEKAARAAVKLLKGHAQESSAHAELGKVCFHRAEKKASLYPCAESAFKTSLALEPSQDAEFYLGVTQLKLSKDTEGAATLRRFVEAYPTDRRVAMARSLIENPLRARKDLLPAFSWSTLNGKRLTNADVAGKVVLLDFWATWCKPCRNAVPTLRGLAEKHKDDPFVMVSVSSDSSEGLVRDFIRDFSVKWPQVWDRGGWGRQNLQVQVLPTYVLFSPEGEVIERYTGGGGGVEKKLEKAVARAIRQAK